MVDQYDSYRIAPRTEAQPFAPSGYAPEFYAPSSSLWGNYTKRAGFGQKPLGVATAFTPAGLLAGIGGPAYQRLTNDPKSLLTAGAWSDIGTFGTRNAKKKQREAKDMRKQAVEQWRVGAETQMGDKLRQSGADVSADLAPSLRSALYAGGEMGDANAMRDAMTQFQQQVQQYMLGRTRASQARDVDAMFSDPSRAADRAKRIGAERDQGLSQLAEQYRIGLRDNAFNQARRGMQGSSVDVEKQGGLTRGRDASAMALQYGLSKKAQAMKLNDMQQRQTLMGLIYADDPSSAAAFSRTLEGLQTEGQGINERQQLGQQVRGLDSATSQNYSQAAGGLLTGLSRPLGYAIEHQGGGA